MGCYYDNRLVQLSEITKQTSLKSACKKTFKHHWWLWTLEWEKIMKNICEPISEAIMPNAYNNSFFLKEAVPSEFESVLAFHLLIFLFKDNYHLPPLSTGTVSKRIKCFLVQISLKIIPIISINFMSVSLSCQNDNGGTTYGKERKK